MYLCMYVSIALYRGPFSCQSPSL